MLGVLSFDTLSPADSAHKLASLSVHPPTQLLNFCEPRPGLSVWGDETGRGPAAALSSGQDGDGKGTIPRPALVLSKRRDIPTGNALAPIVLEGDMNRPMFL
jgi:hypothetical protein